jgi:hypothetical protein
VDSFADGALALLADPRLGEELGRNGRRFVEANHSWDRSAERVEAVVRGVGGRQRPSAAPWLNRDRRAPMSGKRLSICYLVPGHNLLPSAGPTRNVLSVARELGQVGGRDRGVRSRARADHAHQISPSPKSIRGGRTTGRTPPPRRPSMTRRPRASATASSRLRQGRAEVHGRAAAGVRRRPGENAGSSPAAVTTWCARRGIPSSRC